MEDLTIALLHMSLTKTLDLLRNGDIDEADTFLEDVRDILETYLTEGK